MSDSIEREIREQLAGGNALSANDLAASHLAGGSPGIRYLYLLSHLVPHLKPMTPKHAGPMKRGD